MWSLFIVLAIMAVDQARRYLYQGRHRRMTCPPRTIVPVWDHHAGYDPAWEEALYRMSLRMAPIHAAS